MSRDSIIDLLKKQAKLDSNAINEIGADLLNRWVDRAMATHNSTYTYINLPDAQVDCIILLAWRQVCLWRAGKFAQEINTRSGTDYTQDAGTPHKKNMDLAKQLLDEYKQLVTDLKLLPVGETIFQGDLLVENDLFDRLSPLNAVLAPAVAVLTGGAVTDTTAILRWTADYFADFESFIILSDTAPGLFQDWNTEGVFGVPKIRGDVEKDGEVLLFQNQAVKVTGLLPSTTYYFIIVVRSRSGICSYSNEISLTTTA